MTVAVNYGAIQSDISTDESDYIDAISSSTTPTESPASFLKLIQLTCILAGVQFIWTIEMGYGSPYLLSFGISKSALTLAWLAGPLSGLLMQPVIGILSDCSSSKYGKRRPFIVAGSAAIVASLLILAHVRDILALLGFHQIEKPSFDALCVKIVIFCFYVLDFSINCVQATSRSLIVDHLSAVQQPSGHSFASVMIALGNIIGYLVGSMNLVNILPVFCSTQMKALTCFGSFGVIVSTIITCYCIHEKPQIPSQPRVSLRLKLADAFRPLVNPRLIPKELFGVFITQFFNWFAWFPFTFFSTEFIKELWVNETKAPIESGERIGSLALFAFSVVSIVIGVLLPGVKMRLKVRFRSLWASSQLLMAFLLFSNGFNRFYWEACLIVCFMGIPMAVSLWIPFALVGQYISERDESEAKRDDDLYVERNNTGMLLGLHNSFIVLPQFLSSVVCSLIFTFTGNDGMLWVWRAAAISSLIACILASYTIKK